jgi:hypothetical protein
MAAQPRRKVTWQTVKKDEIKLSAVVEEYLQYHLRTVLSCLR